MQTAIAFLADITCAEIVTSMIVIGLLERALYMLPHDLVGPGGRWIDTGRDPMSG